MRKEGRGREGGGIKGKEGEKIKGGKGKKRNQNTNKG